MSLCRFDGCLTEVLSRGAKDLARDNLKGFCSRECLDAHDFAEREGGGACLLEASREKDEVEGELFGGPSHIVSARFEQIGDLEVKIWRLGKPEKPQDAAQVQVDDDESAPVEEEIELVCEEPSSFQRQRAVLVRRKGSKQFEDGEALGCRIAVLDAETVNRGGTKWFFARVVVCSKPMTKGARKR
jgi:hypothetical protein